MENASKALIMAGGILIALMTIGGLIFMFNSISNVEKQKDQNAEIEATLEFNKQFEQFDTVGLRGSDLLTLINKILDYNESDNVKNEGYNAVSMKVTFKDTAIEELKNDNTGNLKNKWDNWFGKSSKEMSNTDAQTELIEFKRKYFKCTNVEYDNVSGRVSSLSFKEIEIN